MFDFISKLSNYPQKANLCIEDSIGDSLSTVFIDLVAGICNHNCIFCDGHFNPLPKKSFSEERLLQMADEFKALHVDSVIIVGEGGESTLHPAFCRFVKKLFELQIRVGLYTNGETLYGEVAQAAADMDFVRISLDSGSAKTHQLVHRAKEGAFDKIIENATDFSKIRKGMFGTSFIVLRENVDEIPHAAQLCEACGFDYLELKPFYAPEYTFDTVLYEQLSKKVEQYYKQASASCTGMSVVLNNQFKEWQTCGFQKNNLTRTDAPRVCYTSKLRLVVSPTGCYLCTCFRNVEAYSLGDPNVQSLSEIWYGQKHLELTRRLCNLKCTYSAQNDYLRDLKEGKSVLPVPNPDLQQVYFL